MTNISLNLVNCPVSGRNEITHTQISTEKLNLVRIDLIITLLLESESVDSTSSGRILYQAERYQSQNNMRGGYRVGIAVPYFPVCFWFWGGVNCTIFIKIKFCMLNTIIRQTETLKKTYISKVSKVFSY